MSAKRDRNATTTTKACHGLCLGSTGNGAGYANILEDMKNPYISDVAQ